MTLHDSPPYRLMFGRDPRLALDVVLGILSEQPSNQNYGKYVTKLKDSLKKAYDISQPEQSQLHSTDRSRIMIYKPELQS